MRILFMGTPDIAAESLRAVCAAGHEVCAVFTREDKPVGRKQTLTAPPAKQEALLRGIPVYQPKTLRDAAVQAQIAALAPELIVVVAYGRILPPAVLSVPRYGCINLHVSLLPRYRGAAPVQWAVLNGDAETGVTIMQLDEGLDTGDILMVERLAIGPEETSGELFARVSSIGAALLTRCIGQIAAGGLTPIPQDHTKATLAPPLTKEMAGFTFELTAQALHNLIRGMNPWPAAWFCCEGKKVKVLKSRLAAGQGAQTPPGGGDAAQGTAVTPGTVLAVKPLTIACKEGALELLELVPEGKKPMEGSAWAAGRRLRAGDILTACAEGPQ